jgi:hypothetical protein
MNNRISINGRNGVFGAYIARPETAPAPAVVDPTSGAVRDHGVDS